MTERPNPPADLHAVARAARGARRRIRARRVVHAVVAQGAPALGVAAVALAAARLGAPGWIARDVALGAALSVLLAAAFALARRVGPLAGARALDTHHALADRVSSALAFAALPEAERSPLMEAAIDDARARAALLRPADAVRIGRPPRLAALALAAGLCALATRVPVRAPPPPLPAPLRAIEPVRLSPDDVELFRDAARAIGAKSDDPEVAAAVAAIDRVLEDVAHERIDRAEAFRRLADLERELAAGRAPDAKALADELAARARALRPSELLRPLADALERRDLGQSEAELRKLAARLRKGPAPSKAELDKLRATLARAAAEQKARVQALADRRDELRRDLERARERRADAGAGSEDESLLRRRERERERAEAELDREQSAQRRLERLDRELEQAADDLARELGVSADDLDRGAEDLNRMAREQLSAEQKEQLRQRIDDLREQLRQQGGDAAEKRAQMRRFLERARGDSGRGAGGRKAQRKECPPGDASCKPDDGSAQGGQGADGGAGGESFELGPDGEPVLVLRRGGSSSAGSGSGAGASAARGQSGGDGDGAGRGAEPGTGHDPSLAGRQGTSGPSAQADLQAVAADTGRGATRSEVIHGAAERGFRGGAYARVFTEYHAVAEQRLHGDEIPPGTRAYVRRYFDLIRPRE